MFSITGITGKVGGRVARVLLRAHRPVRAVVRDVEKGRLYLLNDTSLVAGSCLAASVRSRLLWSCEVSVSLERGSA
jgi:nucleoside-diphosphate-sugar epimerase